MIFKDLREWLNKVEQLGELIRVDGASLDGEVGALVDYYQQEMGKPALLFDEFAGFPKGYRVLANSSSSIKRIALTLNMPEDYSAMDIVQQWRKFLKEYKPIKPRILSTGSVLENQYQGEEVDLNIFPVPLWHPEDGGPYIGTGCFVVNQDPETGWLNGGAYRLQVQGRDKATMFIVKGKHGDIIRNKYWQEGKPMPVAVSLGQDPLYFMIGGLEVPFNNDEYDFMGAIRKEPVDLLETPLYNIPVPAESEIVIEGEIWPEDTLPEGPFGEWTGYYAGGVRDVPVIRIKGIYHRDDPIILGAIPAIPPSDMNYYRSPIRSAMVWDELEKAGVPGIKSVWAHEVGGARLLLIVSIKQLYPGQSAQAGLIASQCHASAYANKAVIVVDEDIDATDLNQVVWAVLTRTDPKMDLTVLNNCWTSKIDPTSYPPGGNYFNSRVVIDACRAWGQLDEFPPVIKVDSAALKIARQKWPHLF